MVLSAGDLLARMALMAFSQDLGALLMKMDIKA
jgi:hypothetical protein